MEEKLINNLNESIKSEINLIDYPEVTSLNVDLLASKFKDKVISSILSKILYSGNIKDLEMFSEKYLLTNNILKNSEVDIMDMYYNIPLDGLTLNLEYLFNNGYYDNYVFDGEKPSRRNRNRTNRQEFPNFYSYINILIENRIKYLKTVKQITNKYMISDLTWIITSYLCRK